MRVTPEQEARLHGQPAKQEASPQFCAGCSKAIIGQAFDWQDAKTNATRWYCYDCDGKLIDGAPLPRDEARR